MMLDSKGHRSPPMTSWKFERKRADAIEDVPASCEQRNLEADQSRL